MCQIWLRSGGRECNAGTVEPLTNDHPHQRPSLSYDHISCDGQGILCVYESLTSDHPSDTTTPMWFWGWSYKRGSTVWQSQNVRKLRYPATVSTFFLARPPLGSLVVRLITGDPIGILGVTYLCVAIRSLVTVPHTNTLTECQVEFDSFSAAPRATVAHTVTVTASVSMHVSRYLLLFQHYILPVGRKIGRHDWPHYNGLALQWGVL